MKVLLSRYESISIQTTSGIPASIKRGFVMVRPSKWTTLAGYSVTSGSDIRPNRARRARKYRHLVTCRRICSCQFIITLCAARITASIKHHYQLGLPESNPSPPMTVFMRQDDQCYGHRKALSPRCPISRYLQFSGMVDLIHCNCERFFCTLIKKLYVSAIF